MEQDKKNSPMPEKKSGDKDSSENKLFGVMAYLGILFLIPLLAKKDSEFAQFHAKQGMLLFIGWVVLSWIPVLNLISWAFLTVLSIIGIVNVLGEKKEKLPIVGDLAEKLKI